MMIVAFSFHAGDVHLADQLIRWIGKLSDCSTWPCILVADAGTPFDKVIALKARAEQVFESATIVSTDQQVSGWPAGPNNNWRTAIAWGRLNKQAILFLEPDAIPLKPSWLMDIAREWVECEKQHLGSIYTSGNVHLPAMVMSGVAVYGPGTTWPILPTLRPWNVDMAELLIAQACNTYLIKDFFGPDKDTGTIFVEHEQPGEPVNHRRLEWIPESAVLFHRDKTQSLIPLLAKRLGIVWEPPRKPAEPITVVFNVHRGDIHLALHHTLWLHKMGRKWKHRAIVSYDPSLGQAMANQFMNALRPCFDEVAGFCYPLPPVPTYPATANWAFQSVALHMTHYRTPWLWFEADAIVLRPDWLEELQREYEMCGKDWMGPHVNGMQHANGTMIYPADACQRMPKTMSCGTAEAFDMVAAEIMGQCHNCNHLLFHTWSILNGEFWPVPGGVVPANITAELARKIPPSAVMIHRVKDRSLVDLLLTGKYQHA